MPGSIQKFYGPSFVALLSGLLLAGMFGLASGSLPRVQEIVEPPHFQGTAAAERTLGPNACGECHIAELDSWKDSAHATGYNEMHRSDAAKDIAKALGMRRIKREDACIRCHYSEQMDEDKTKVIDGVTCESCHGPARDWMPVHDNYGGAGIGKADESPEHRAKRRHDAIAAGMHRPDDLYHLAASCFRCHIMGDSQIVEVGGHGVDTEFELLAYSQGEVRHNFMATDGKSNSEPSAEHRRVLYLLGQLLDLEYSLRVLGGLKAGGTHADALAARVTRVATRLDAAVQAVEVAELKAALEIAKKAELKAGAESLAAAASEAGRLARAFAKNDGKSLGAIDAILPAKEMIKGKAKN